MPSKIHLSFLTMILLISFASVNAVLFTPALPSIAEFFHISTDKAQWTLSGFLIAYALGQLVYGPIANRFGRKPALYTGIMIQIFSSLLCVFAGIIQSFGLLLLGRFLLAAGSGVGLKMTFTLVNECYEPLVASQKTARLMLAFAITPALSIALGGILNIRYGWMSCFYAGAFYGCILLYLVTRLPETQTVLDLNAFKPRHLLHAYGSQFKNSGLIAGGLLMGCSTAFVYVFAALAPFIAINISGMNSMQYGMANLLPPLGLISGSLLGARISKNYSFQNMIGAGISLSSLGVLCMLLAEYFPLSPIIRIFIPMILVYFGLCFVIPNASTLAMTTTSDKAHGSAVMNFVNMGFATLSVLSLGFFHATAFLLPAIFLILSLLMAGIFIGIRKANKVSFSSG